uniref:Uncharacterized protein n=1 Tax=Lepeophtheirus salmonis TaxID=72036 RepID=A0A0K2TZY9_LEPSM
MFENKKKRKDIIITKELRKIENFVLFMIRVSLLLNKIPIRESAAPIVVIVRNIIIPFLNSGNYSIIVIRSSINKLVLIQECHSSGFGSPCPCHGSYILRNRRCICIYNLLFIIQSIPSCIK